MKITNLHLTEIEIIAILSLLVLGYLALGYFICTMNFRLTKCIRRNKKTKNFLLLPSLELPAITFPFHQHFFSFAELAYRGHDDKLFTIILKACAFLPLVATLLIYWLIALWLDLYKNWIISSISTFIFIGLIIGYIHEPSLIWGSLLVSLSFILQLYLYGRKNSNSIDS